MEDGGGDRTLDVIFQEETSRNRPARNCITLDIQSDNKNDHDKQKRKGGIDGHF